MNSLPRLASAKAGAGSHNSGRLERSNEYIVKVLKWLDKYFEIGYLMVALVTIVVVMSMQIFSRKLLGISLAWSEECCRHLFIGMGLWGIGLTIKEDSAIKFDLILGFLSDKWQRIIGVISNSMIAVFFVCLIQPAISVYQSMKNTTATMMPYNMNIVYGLVLVGVVMVVIRAVQQVIRNGKMLAKGTDKESDNT